MGFDSSMTASCPRSALTASFPCIHFVYVSHCLSYQLAWRSLSSVKAVSCGCSVIPRNKVDVHSVFASMLLDLCCALGVMGHAFQQIRNTQWVPTSDSHWILSAVLLRSQASALQSGYEGQSWIIDASSSVYKKRKSRLKAKKWLSSLSLVCWWEVACFLSAMPVLIYV